MASPADDAPRAERLLSGDTGRLALIITGGWFVVLLGRQALPPLLPTVIEQLAINETLAGFALTLLMGLYALLQYPAGRLSDALSRTTVLVASVAGMLVGFALLATVTSYLHLLLGAAVLGVSSAFYFTPAVAFLADLFVDRRGEAMGMLATAGMAGSALAAAVALVALELGTWQAAFLPAIVVLAVLGLLLHRWSHEPYVLRGARVDLDLRATAGRLFGTAELRRLLAMRALAGFTFQAIVGFLPAFLQLSKGVSPTVAGLSYGLFFVIGGIAPPLAGRLSDRIPRLQVVLGGLVMALVGLGALLVARGLLPIVASTLVLALGIMGLLPAIQAYLLDFFPTQSVGGDYGAAKTVFTGVGSLGPAFVGVLIGAVGYTTAFASLGPVLLVAVGLLLTVHRSA